MIALKVEGMQELVAQLKGMYPTLKTRKVFQKAVRKALKPVLAAAQAKVPVDTGLLKSSIKIASAEAEDLFAAGLLIGTGKGGGGKDIAKAGKAAAEGQGGKARRTAGRLSAHWRWHFIERGVPAHGVAAKPFLRPALDSNAQTAIDIIIKELRREIDAEAKRQTKRKKAAIINTLYAGTAE